MIAHALDSKPVTKPATLCHLKRFNPALKKGAQVKFSKAAGDYNTHAHVQKKAADDLFKLITPLACNKNKVCVDLGAGPLVNTHQLKSLYGNVLSMDLSFNMLNSCNKGDYKVCADMDNLPLQSNSVDIVFSNFAVQWSANFNVLLKSLYEVLKPGGQAFISTVVEGSLNEIKTAFAAVDSHSHINTFNSVDYINQSVQSSGFNVTNTISTMYTDKYSTPLQAIRSIKAIGATTHNTGKTRPGLLTKSALKTACAAYPLINQKACVSYHVVLLSLTKA